MMSTSSALPNAIIFGTGEYTTGYLGDEKTTESDKVCGVVGLVHFDLRARGKLGPRIAFCGTNGRKFPAIRAHLKRSIQDVYAGLRTEEGLSTFPADDVSRDPEAFRRALAEHAQPGDIVSVFTPDDTHYAIIMASIAAGCHVMATKPIVLTLAEHRAIVAAAAEKQVLVQIEVHKRYDPMYADARNRIRNLGDFGFFSSFMTQPKFQLQTFKAWAGRSSDISYYLNSHHIDFHCWCLQGLALPERVTASAAKGVCQRELGVDGEDTITLQVQWRNKASGALGVAVYTSSWSASNSADVHSQQRFHYQGHGGDVTIDQAHRGYFVGEDGVGFKSVNPLYMAYTPDTQGRFVGQHGYGYKSFEQFVDAVLLVRAGKATPADFDASAPTAATCLLATAILEAGRRSLDTRNMPIIIEYEGEQPTGFAVAT